MRKIVRRLFRLDLPRGKSAFLWGPRKVGKSYWIAHNLKHAAVIVSLEEMPRRMGGGIEVVPWRTFIDRLWGGDFV